MVGIVGSGLVKHMFVWTLCSWEDQLRDVLLHLKENNFTVFWMHLPITGGLSVL